MPSKNGSGSKIVNVISKWPTDCYVFPMVHSDILRSQTERVLLSVSNQEQTLQVALMAAFQISYARTAACMHTCSAMLCSFVTLCAAALNKSPNMPFVKTAFIIESSS